VALIGLYGAFPTMAKKDKVLFIQQDKVVHLQFIPLDGFEGAQTGTATGEINASICLEYLANLDLSLRVRRVGAALQPFDGFFLRLHLPQPEAGD
jgi:hypothetical protein